MEIQMYVINAFTAPNLPDLRTGNPAAVALLTEEQDAKLNDESRQQLAAEMNLSETAFVTRVPNQDATENKFAIRWFTPATEVDLCGHATLASARAVMEEKWVSQGDIIFQTQKQQVLRVKACDDELMMEFPALVQRQDLTGQENETLRKGLDAEVVESFRSDYDIVARVADKTSLVNMKIDFDQIGELDTRGVIVTADGEDGVRFVSRFFAPRVGIREDPVTGSAHCVLAGMFVNHGDTNVEARQLSQRGGWLKIGRPDTGVVSMAGRTRVVWKGTVFL